MTQPSHLGPRFPLAEDLPQWKKWQKSQQPRLRRAKQAIQPLRGQAQSEPVWLIRGTQEVRTLIALESYSATQMAALAEPVKHAGSNTGIAYLLPNDAPPSLPGIPSGTPVESASETLPEAFGGLKQVLAAGTYLRVGNRAYQWANHTGVRFIVAQHGLLASQAPPLPRDCELLAFTADDADWWSAGRSDVTSKVVGSQLLWSAASKESSQVKGSKAPEPGQFKTAEETQTGRIPGLFLGQLHGAELPRKDFAQAALLFCRETGAAYRPHPVEVDRLSRLTHRLWKRRGITIDNSAVPLHQTQGPVAAVFSTGLLEAAYAGRDAWAVHPDPPRWLMEFWERYGMTRWVPGAQNHPSSPPALPLEEPSKAVADRVFGKQGSSKEKSTS